MASVTDESVPCYPYDDPSYLDDLVPLDLDPEGFSPGAPLDAGLPFAEWLEVQASVHAVLGGTAGAWLAERIREIATTARFVSARTPDDYDARVRVLEWDREHAIEERGRTFAGV